MCWTCTHTYANGDKYVGEYKDGKLHGQGTFTYANGDKWVGEWKDGKQYRVKIVKPSAVIEKPKPSSLGSELATLNKLYKSGVLTKSEFEKGKTRILNQ